MNRKTLSIRVNLWPPTGATSVTVVRMMEMRKATFSLPDAQSWNCKR